MNIEEEGIPPPPRLPIAALGSSRATYGVLVAVGICCAFFLVMLVFFARHQQQPAGDPILIITPTNTLGVVATNTSFRPTPTLRPTVTPTHSSGGQGGGGTSPTATPKPPPTPTATSAPFPTPTPDSTRQPAMNEP